MNYISDFYRKGSQWRCYVVAVLAVAIAMLLKLLLHPLIDHESPFLVFFAAVLVSALYGGMGAGALATVLAALISNYLFLSPTYSFFNHNLGQNLQLGIFVLEGIAVSSVVAALNSAKRQAELSRLKTLHHQETLRQSEERFRLLVEGVRDYAIFMLNSDGHVASWNTGAERIFGYQEAEIIGQHFSCIFAPEDIHNHCPEQELRTALAMGKADDERWHIRSDGTSFWASGVLTALRDNHGDLQGFSKVVRDITDRKRAEEALQKANDELEIRVENRTAELRNAFERLQSEIIERQRTQEALQESKTRLKLINSISTGMMLGMSVEQIIQRTLKQISEYFNTLRVAYSTIDDQGNLSVIHSIEPQGMPQLKGLVMNLTTVPDYLSALRLHKPVIVEDVAQDVRLAFLAAAIKANGTQALLDVPLQHPDNLVGLLCFESPQTWEWSEHEIATLVGITQYLSIIIKNAHAEQERKQAEQALQEAHKELEIRVKNRTAELAIANEELRSEIRDRKRAESELRASEERLRLALEVARMGTWDWNILTNQVTWSHNYELLFGLTPGTFAGTYKAVLSCVHPEDRQLVASAATSCIKERVCYDYEFRIVWHDGSIRWMAGKSQVFYDETDTTAVRMVGTTMDITDRKQAADQLKASLQEKEVLLKEIHHRVKNNMQIISSLLNLQSGHVEDEQTLELLKESQNRVASMALIHEQLYQSEDLARIDFAEYIQILATNLFSAYDISSEEIALKINVDDFQLSVDAAITCGLIMNELVCNSLKYAFPGRTGEVCIHFHSDNDNNLTLKVSDNGIGLPQNFDLKNAESLGLQLVTALTNQLEGTIDINNNMGTEFKITFPNKKN